MFRITVSAKQRIAATALIFISCVCAQAALQTLHVQELDGVTTQNYPLTFPLVFNRGIVTQGIEALVEDTKVAVQVDIKNRYADGSLRLGIVSLLIPELPGGKQVTISINALSSDRDDASSWNADSLLQTAPDLRCRFGFYADSSMNAVSARDTVSVRQILAHQTNKESWLAGPVAREYLLNDTTLNPHPSVNLQYQVRAYKGWEGYRVSVVTVNCWHNTRGALYYDVAVDAGKQEYTTLFSRQKHKHYRDSRWRRVFWVGKQPSRVQVKFDANMWIDAGFIPPYQIELGQTEKALAARYEGYLKGDCYGCSVTDIGTNGIVYGNLEAHGGRDDRKFFPLWTTDYLYSMDWRLEEIVRSAGQQAAHFPVHMRYRDKNRVIQYSDFPNKFPWDPNWNWKGWGHFTEFPNGNMNTKLNVGWGYPPSLAYMPFLITGDYYYLEEQLYWASYSFWWGGRHAGGKIVEKDRSPAMYLRTVMNAWSILPDSAPERRYYAERIEASIDSALNHIHTIDKDNQFGVYRVEDVKHENNYFIIGVTDQLARLGFSKAAQWRDFMLRLPVGMLTNHPQFNKFDAINYFSTYIDHQCAPACSEGYRIPSSWADLYQVMLNQTERQAGTENVNMPRKDYYETTYVGYLLYVLGIAARTDFPKGREAYELLYDYYKNDKVNYCVTPLGGCFDSRDWLRTSNQPISAQRSPTLTSPTTAFAVTTTQGMLTVSTASQRAAQVRIFDLAGRRIAARPLLPDSHSGMRSAHVDFRGTSRAMYVVQVNGETSMTKTILLP